MRHPYAEFLIASRSRRATSAASTRRCARTRRAVDARVCLAFPDVYDIGMSHLGTKILYALLNKQPRIACERAFAPWVDMEARAARARAAARLARERARRCATFDVVGFSLQYELTYTNVLTLLDLGGIPLRAARPRRRRAARHRAAVRPRRTPSRSRRSSTRSSSARARRCCPALVLRVGARCERAGRAAARAADPAGRAAARVYVPSLYDDRRRRGHRPRGRRRRRSIRACRAPVARVLVARPQRVPVPRRHAGAVRRGDLRPHVGRDRARLHRGLPLLPGGHDLPPGARARSGRRSSTSLVGGVKKGGYDETVAHVAVDRRLLVHHAAGQEGDGASSRRSRCRCRCRRCAPTASTRICSTRWRRCAPAGSRSRPRPGTQRMRDVVNKNVTEEDIIESARARVLARLVAHEALLHDRPADREGRGRRAASSRPAARVQAIGRQLPAAAPRSPVGVDRTCPSRTRRSSGRRWTATTEIARKQALLRDAARARCASTLKMHENQQSHIEGIFSRGDRRLADVLEAAFRLGCRFDGWDDSPALELWDARSPRRGATASTSTRYLGTLPVDGAAAVGPHRRRARGGFLAEGVPQGAQGSAVARRAASRQAARCTRPTSRDAEDADAAQAGLLRLRRRLRPRRR